MEKPQYTVEELTAMLTQQIESNVKFSNALGVALMYLPEHARWLVAEALGGGEEFVTGRG